MKGERASERRADACRDRQRRQPRETVPGRRGHPTRHSWISARTRSGVNSAAGPRALRRPRFEHIDLVGPEHRILYVLVDEQDRRAERRPCLQQEVIDLLDERWSEPRRRLVHQHQGRLGHHLACHREHAPLPSRKVAGSRFSLGRKRGKHFVDARHARTQPRRVAPEGPAAHAQIVLDREKRKGVDLLGHVAHPEPLDRVRLPTGDRLAIQPDRPSVRLQQAEDRLQQCRFAGSVRPDHEREAVLRDLEREALQDVDAALIAGMEILDLEQRRASHEAIRSRGEPEAGCGRAWREAR